MITPTRQAILRELEALSQLSPDVRFGQLIVNLSYLALGAKAEAPWDIEDEELLQAIREHAAFLSQRHVTAA